MKFKSLISLMFIFQIFALHAEYFSECQQDKFLNEVVFKEKHNGFFIEIGANNGIDFSNSYFFEKFLEWDGICIEPHPIVFDELHNNRKCLCLNIAISNSEGEKDFVCHTKSSFLSGLLNKYDPKHIKRWNTNKVIADKNNIVKVQSYLLNDVLEKNKVTDVDFLSLDTEGGELDILKSINLNKYNIKIIVVENLYNSHNISDFLNSKGYSLINKLSKDEIYSKND
jgi:FkbM family methyltransferase